MLISQILKNKGESVATISSDKTLSDAVDLLSTQKIGAVIISDDGDRPLGILSERDIVSALGRVGTQCLSRLVTEYMTKKLVTCGPSERAIQVLTTMSEGRFRHMPVIDGEKMVGIVSIGDVVEARLQELSQQADALKNMIMGY